MFCSKWNGHSQNQKFVEDTYCTYMGVRVKTLQQFTFILSVDTHLNKMPQHATARCRREGVLYIYIPS